MQIHFWELGYGAEKGASEVPTEVTVRRKEIHTTESWKGTPCIRYEASEWKEFEARHVAQSFQGSSKSRDLFSK